MLGFLMGNPDLVPPWNGYQNMTRGSQGVIQMSPGWYKARFFGTSSIRTHTIIYWGQNVMLGFPMENPELVIP